MGSALILKPKEALIKSVRVEPVETQASRIKGFDKLCPNSSYLFSISLTLSAADRLRQPLIIDVERQLF